MKKTLLYSSFMEFPTLFLLQIIAPVYLVMGLSIFFNKNLYRNIVDSMENNFFGMFLAGIMIFILGLLIVTYHNIWRNTPEIIVSLVGWLSVLKGLFYILFPGMVVKMGKMAEKNKYYLSVSGTLCLLIGGYVFWMAYLA